MKNKTVWGVIGVLLTLFGIMFTISTIITQENVYILPLTGFSVIAGVILMAWAITD